AVRKTLRGSPRGAVITENRLGEPVAAKDCLQVAFNGRPALIRAGLGSHRIPRVIIDNGQRVAPVAVVQFEFPFKIHLPQSVGGGPLEASPRAFSSVRVWVSEQPSAI